MTRDDELLASYVAGELSDDSAEIRELLARRPDALAAAAELATLTRQLDAGGALERRLIAAARVQTTPEDRARVAALAPAPRAKGLRGVNARWLAAAALIVAAVGLALHFRGRTSSERQVQVLNNDRDARIVLRAPQAPLAAGVALEWDAPALAPGERFALEFRALDGQGSAGKLLAKVRCSSASWTPSTADLNDWPEQVELVIARIELESGARELALSRPFSLRVAR